ncbi:MAG: YjbE family putative metal transport protein [Ancalomicrobiaceae bacterium]|nr:YjbE family putative metal transport protein [Ancalomicrobiaceae bacterium]
MDFETYVSWISNPVQIAFIDLILGADNAVIIALVCSTLPRRQRMNVLIVGTGAAILLRLFLTAVAGALMSVPLLRLLGGLVLVLIAVGLVDETGEAGARQGDDGGPEDFADRQAASEAFWDAILLVALADGVMSLDNTVALAAVAKGDILFLLAGLALSVPMLVFGSWLLTELFGTTPWFVRAAMAVLGWVAGDMAVSDPLIAGWVHDQAPALTYAGPLAAVIFVLVQGAIYRRRRRREAALLPPAPDPVANAVSPVGEGGGVPAGPLASRELLAALAGIDGVTPDASDAGPQITRAEPVVAPVPATPPDPQPPETAAAVVADQVGEPVAALAEPSQAEAAGPLAADASAGVGAPAETSEQDRPREDRLMVIGLIVLFLVAAVLISAAIVIGGATF